jgi:hypothetical protein
MRLPEEVSKKREVTSSPVAEGSLIFTLLFAIRAWRSIERSGRCRRSPRLATKTIEELKLRK